MLTIMYNSSDLFFTAYHKSRYNTSMSNPCVKSRCSHLCLTVPGGFVCACPDNTIIKPGANNIFCDAGLCIRVLLFLVETD